MRLQVVHVGAIAVCLLVDRVTSAMQIAVAIAGRFDNIAGGAVDFEATQRGAGAESLVAAIESGVTCPPHDVEDLEDFRRRFGTNEGAPGNVRIDRPRRALLRPDVEEEEITRIHRRRFSRRNFEVRISRMLVDRKNRRVIGYKVVRFEVADREVQEASLADAAAGAKICCDKSEDLVDERAKVTGRPPVPLQLHFVEGRLEVLNKVRVGDDVDAERADQLHRPCVDSRHRRNVAPRRILQGDSLTAVSRRPQTIVKGAPGEVDNSQ